MANSVPKVTATSTRTPGRYLLSARYNHFASDATDARGGLGEAIGAAELYLSALATCGLALITEAARRDNIDDSSFGAEASYSVDPSDKTRFEWVELIFTLPGLDPRLAEDLVASFTNVCPIYNTVARDTTVTVKTRT